MPVQPLQDLMAALEGASTQSGEKLSKLAEESPILLVFLRHAGCTFCREALGDIARTRAAIEGTGTRIILVHMRDSEAIGDLMVKYQIQSVDRICDPDQNLYRAFGLKRGSWRQLFGPKVLLRGLKAGILGGHGIGRLSADSFQLPGTFFLNQAGILRRYRHRSAADRPDYAGLCSAADGCGGG
jgi:peroxiredoxin